MMLHYKFYNSKAVHVFIISLYAFFIPTINSLSQEIPDTISIKEAAKGWDGDYVIETLADQNYTIVINEILASNASINADENGEFDDWFEVYNYGEQSINLSDFYFTDNKNNWTKWKIDDTNEIILKPNNYYIFWADDEDNGLNHTNFKLSSDGEYLAIYTLDGNLVHEVDFDEQTSDISYGCYPDGGLQYFFLLEPTPNEMNNDSYAQELLERPISNTNSGFYSNSLSIKLSDKNSGSIIRYTTDNSTPTVESTIYSEPLIIYSTTVIRAKSFKQGCIESPTLSLSYIISEENFENPIISIVSDDCYLYGTQGILTGKPDIEIPASLEFIENGQTVYTSDMGVKLHSPKSHKQYSMRFYARGRYGNTWFNYPFFDERGVSKFKRLIIRNSGNDCVHMNNANVQFRDQLTHQMAKEFTPNANISDSKPVNVFVNGKFFGLYNLRERIDEYYMETHFPEITDYDLIERAFGYPANKNPIHGNLDRWNDIMDFVVREDSIMYDDDFEIISQFVDIEQFTDYWLTEIIIGNYDWLSNNLKFFVPANDKMQWIYWDTDHSMGLPIAEFGEPDWNTLEWSLTFSDRAWSNGYNNRLIRNLLKNKTYKEYFINRMVFLLNTRYTSENVNAKLDSISSLIETDIEKHIAKWGSSITNWNNAISNIKDYFEQRDEYLFQYLKDFFELGTLVQLQVLVEPANSGLISFNNYKGLFDNFQGNVFTDYNYTFKAHAKYGYVFTGWQLLDNSSCDSICIRPETDKILVANFEIDTTVSVLQASQKEMLVNVYPNPVLDKIFISIKDNTQSDLNLTISNSIGITLLDTKIRNTEEPIVLDISGFTSGIYIISLNKNGKFMTFKKFVVD